MDLGHWEVGSEVKAGDVGRYLYNHSSSILSEDCTDEREECELWEAFGDCERFSYVRQVCRLSCGECVPSVEQSSLFPCVVEWHGAGAEYNQRLVDWNVPSSPGEGLSYGYHGMPWVHAMQWHDIEIAEPPQQLGQLCPLVIRNEAVVQVGGAETGVTVAPVQLSSLSTSLSDRRAVYQVDYMLPVPGEYRVEAFQYTYRRSSEGEIDMVFALLQGFSTYTVQINGEEPEPEPEPEPMELERKGWEDKGCRAVGGHGSGEAIDVLRRVPISSGLDGQGAEEEAGGGDGGDTTEEEEDEEELVETMYEIMLQSTPCPAVSCKQIQADYPLAPSGEYWVRSDDPTLGSWATPGDGPSTLTVPVMCDMTIAPFFTPDELVSIYSDLYMAHLRALDSTIGYHVGPSDNRARSGGAAAAAGVAVLLPECSGWPCIHHRSGPDYPTGFGPRGVRRPLADDGPE